MQDLNSMLSGQNQPIVSRFSYDTQLLKAWFITIEIW